MNGSTEVLTATDNPTLTLEEKLPPEKNALQGWRLDHGLLVHRMEFAPYGRFGLRNEFDGGIQMIGTGSTKVRRWTLEDGYLTPQDEYDDRVITAMNFGTAVDYDALGDSYEPDDAALAAEYGDLEIERPVQTRENRRQYEALCMLWEAENAWQGTGFQPWLKKRDEERFKKRQQWTLVAFP
ncbi:hypothetical protein ACIQRN_16480 [[Kitasatospora] papulosa]|uniref:hypothetical protein n=1 Tax=[Kitasatospora] papulosa TaxID=1464011 RepID=UPI0038308414